MRTLSETKRHRASFALNDCIVFLLLCDSIMLTGRTTDSITGRPRSLAAAAGQGARLQSIAVCTAGAACAANTGSAAHKRVGVFWCNRG